MPPRRFVSYEVPLGLSLLAAVVCAGTMSLNEMTEAQDGWIWSWFIFRNPFMWAVFIIYYIASLAECQRAPFDLPEAESELVSGFHTEYSGMRFAIFFLAEYGKMYVVSALAVVMFFGGWYTGIPAIDNIGGLAGNLIGAGVMVTKSMLLVCVADVDPLDASAYPPRPGDGHLSEVPPAHFNRTADARFRFGRGCCR